MTPSCTAIIVTFNSADRIGPCLQALLAEDGAPAAVIVVDNASSDGTPAVLARHWPQVSVITNAVNRGFGAAMNQGLRAAATDRVLLLNPDARVTPGAAARLFAVLDTDPTVAIAGPRLLDEDGRAELSYGSHIGPWTELRQKLRGRALLGGWPLLAGVVERGLRRPGFPDWVSGACWAARRQVLETAGYFDERFFLYTEDVDLCARVRATGARVAYVPDAIVRHARGASRATAPTASDAHYRRSHVAFYEKHHPRWAPLLRTYLKVRGRLPDIPTDHP